MLEILTSLLPALLTFAVSVGFLFGAHRLLLHRPSGAVDHNRLGGQVTMIVLTIIAAAFFLVTLPVGDTTRGQLLSLLGLAVTAAITLSSATFVGNIMAGLMLRSVGNFVPGDYVRVGEHFGRVTVRGLFHTEIQTVDRDLTTLPNFYLVSTPTTVVRDSGTIISCSLSLGYDNHHRDVEALLLKAAEGAGLSDAFVHIGELGDFSVSYRVAGFLADVKSLLRTRSTLRANVLDVLHAAGVEVMSPNFMAQRPMASGERVVPTRNGSRELDEQRVQSDQAEDVVFDKANKAEELEQAKRSLEDLEQEARDSRAKAGDVDHGAAAKLSREVEAKKAETEQMERELREDEKGTKG